MKKYIAIFVFMLLYGCSIGESNLKYSNPTPESEKILYSKINSIYGTGTVEKYINLSRKKMFGLDEGVECYISDYSLDILDIRCCTTGGGNRLPPSCDIVSYKLKTQ